MIRVGTAGLLCLLTATSASSQSRQDAVVAADIDSFVQQVMTAGLIPGLAISVVRDSDVIYAKGFGFADRETGRQVTADTQFYIASTTKSFTALAAAILADRGQIDLNRSLAADVPGIRLQPPLSADRISLRDLLSMTHGIEPIGPVDFRTAYTGEFTNDLLRPHTGNRLTRIECSGHTIAMGGRSDGTWEPTTETESWSGSAASGDFIRTCH